MTVSVQNPVVSYSASGSNDTFAYTFRVIAEEDLKVYLDGTLKTLTTDYTITGLGNESGGSVVFTSPPSASVVVRLQRLVTLDRDTDYINGGDMNADTIDTDFDRIVQQVQDLDRTAFKETSTGTLDAESRIIENVATPVSASDAVTKTYVDSTIPASVSAAAASAAAASTSETNAATSETNAATSETNAATSESNASASATAAANSAGSLIWNDVQFLTSADSPKTLTDADRGVLFAVDTSSGAVTINLLSIAVGSPAATLPFTVGVKKTSSDSNAITINANGTDTIDGSSSKTLQGQDSGATLVADSDPTPDIWTSIDIGPVTGNMTVDTFVDGVDYTSGSSTTLTLSVEAGTSNNIWVYFDGIAQHHTEFSISGTTLTFTEAIPSGTNDIQVHIGTAQSIGTPSDGTVTLAKTSGSLIAVDTFINTTSGTSHDFTVPSTANKVTVMFWALSTTGTSRPIVQLGDSGGLYTSGYTFIGSTNGSSVSATNGFIINGVLAASSRSGVYTFSRLGGNVWCMSGNSTDGATDTLAGAGSIALSDTLTTIRLTTQGGTDTFDVGYINCFYE